MSEKRGRGRPKANDPDPGKPFDFKEYYKDHVDQFRVAGNIKYYKKITNTTTEEIEAYKKAGLSFDKILAKLKEKALISKLAKLHGTGV
jgi:hypothetical protein